MNSKQLLECLLKLQSLAEAPPGAEAVDGFKKQTDELRAQIPLPILSHYDRLLARGKKGLAKVLNQTCTGCHVQVTRATVMSLMHGEDIQICENCGRYLYLPETKEPELPAKKPSKSSSRKSRKPIDLPCAA